MGKRFRSISKTLQISEKNSQVVGTTELGRLGRSSFVDSVDSGRIHAGHTSGIRIMETGLASLGEFVGLKVDRLDSLPSQPTVSRRKDQISNWHSSFSMISENPRADRYLKETGRFARVL